MIVLSLVLPVAAPLAAPPTDQTTPRAENPPAEHPPAENPPADPLQDELRHLLKAYSDQRYGDAEAAGRRALALGLERYGEQHRVVAETRVMLGLALAAQQQHAEAQHVLSQGIAVLSKGAPSMLLGTAHFHLGMSHRQTGKLALAVSSLSASVQAYLAASGPTNGNTMAAQEVLAETQGLAGMWEGAVTTYAALLPVQRKLLAPDDPRLGRNLARWGLALDAAGRHDAAIIQLTAAAGVYEQVAPESSAAAQLGQVLKALGAAQRSLGKLADAEATLRRAVTAIERHYDEGSAERSGVYSALGLVLIDRGNFDPARQWLERSLAIDRKLGDPDGPQVIVALNNLGMAWRKAGDNQKAIHYYEQALGIARVHAPRTRTLPVLLDNMAQAVMELGHWDHARQLLEEAEAKLQALPGDQRRSVAVNLAAQAQLHKHVGDAEGALVLARRSLALYEAVLPPGHPELGVPLDNVATMLADLGRYAEAVTLYKRALVLHETLGADHPRVATNLNNMAWALRELGRHEEALAVYERAVGVAERRLGATDPVTTAARSALGSELVRAGKVKRGLALLRAAVADTAKALGDSHPWVAERRGSLADALIRIGDVKGARREVVAALNIVETNVDALMYGTSERERLRVVASQRQKLDRFVALQLDAGLAYDAVLRWKAAVLTSLGDQRRLLSEADDPAVAEKLATLLELRRRAAMLAVAVPEPGRAEAIAHELSTLRETRERLERELARTSRGLADKRTTASAGWREVCAALGKEEAVVDFTRYVHTELADGETPHLRRESRYVAFVLTGGACEAPQRVALGAASTIDTAVDEFRESLDLRDEADEIIDLARAVRTRVWDPIRPHLGGRTTIRVISDGALHRVPLQALPRGGRVMPEDARFLIERYHFSYLSTARELLKPAPVAEGAGSTGGALVVGGVVYDGAGRPNAPVTASRGAGCGLDGALNYSYLPGTKDEATAVAAALKNATVLSGAEATETAVSEALQRARVVHLATHGYFASGCRAATAGGSERGDAIGVNPLVLSGIALAGANGDRNGRGGDDGILTAEEVAGLDLRGLRLAVLSACETGLGNIAVGEGVLGLRWAFSLAGARSLMMSLWKVPDQETRQLMEAVHAALAQGRSPAEALRSGQLALLGHLREQGDPNPWLWAAFIASGR